MSEEHRPPILLDAEAPDLRIVPLGKLIPHELHDTRRAKPLIEQLRQDGVLRNPPVVTSLDSSGDRYVILDGANRMVALDVLGISHVVVQVVPYRQPYVELSTWHHAITGIPIRDFQRCLESLSDLEMFQCDIFRARAALARRAILAYCLLPDGQVTTLAGGGFDLHRRTELLKNIVDAYLGIGHLNRVSTDYLDELLTFFPDLSGVVVFPKYEPVEILDLARNGLRVPAGITRHIIRGRALRLNYPLTRLNADISIEAKNDELRAWVQERFEHRGVRYYAESTYLFDE